MEQSKVDGKKERGVSITVQGDLSRDNGTIKMNFKKESYPSDESIFKNSYNGLLDNREKIMTSLTSDDPHINILKRIESFVMETYPESANGIVITDEEKQKERERKLDEIHAKIKAERASGPQCDCDDVACPHKTGAMEFMMEAARLDDGITYNITKFNPFDFPIISLPYDCASIVSMILPDEPLGMYRMITRFRLDLNVTTAFTVPRSLSHLIEAVFFPEELPDTFTFRTNENGIAIKPTRRYNFLGLQKYPRYAVQDLSFKAPEGKSSVDFCIIGWLFGDDDLHGLFSRNEIISTFELDNGLTIEQTCLDMITIKVSEPK
jgi:hypothetical protein